MDSRKHSFCRLLPCHSRLIKHIFCPVHYLIFRFCYRRHIRRHTDIHRKKIRARDFSHQTYACCTPGKVFRHNGGHFLSGLSHAFSHHAVVSTHNDKTFFFDRIICLSSDPRHTDNCLFQLSEAVQRFSYCLPVRGCRLHTLLICRLYLSYPLFQFFFEFF